MLLSPNTLLQNRYLVVRQIGQGGMGAVYEAKDQHLGHMVALKQRLADGPRLERAFKREARILARLRHPALPSVSDYFVVGNNQFLVMEYIPGHDLESLLRRQRGPFSVTKVLEWAESLLDALQYLHSHDPPIIHRDIKPANIKLSPRCDLVLLDFGLSKGGTTGSSLTMSSGSIHAFTPTYAPLEQINHSGTDSRSDIYSLGATLYYLLTGVAPPTASTRAEAQVRQIADPLRPANQVNPQIPTAVAHLLTQAMALNPAQRLSSAKAMRDALHAQTLLATQKDPSRFFEFSREELGYGIKLGGRYQGVPLALVTSQWITYRDSWVKSGWLYVPQFTHNLADTFYKIHLLKDGTGYIHILTSANPTHTIWLETNTGFRVEEEFCWSATVGAQRTALWRFTWR